MDEADAIDVLRDLGLSKYEAEVFVALQKLTVGTAKDVAGITDVPRSQVYGAAESLEERGLLEVHRSNPMEFRATDLSEAEERLGRRLERKRRRAFDAIESIQGTHSADGEHQEAVWTIHGRETITDRVRTLVEDAEEYVVYGSDDPLLDDAVADALADRAADGLDVTVVTADEDVIETVDDADVAVLELDDERVTESWVGGRLLVVDGDAVLLSVLGHGDRPGIREETAIWSAETGFAAVLVHFIDGWFGRRLQL